MNPKLHDAINAFIINEYKLEPHELDPDFEFAEDLGLSKQQLEDFLQRLQEALSIIIPEEKIASIVTLEDLYNSLGQEDDQSL